MDVYYLLLILLLCATTNGEDRCKNTPKCRISRVHKMKSADCFKRDIRTFPKCLTSDLEIIDLRENRIKRLEKNDLSNYGSLKMLYLTDNVILSIDKDFFDGKYSLTTLDLAMNGITKIPPAVFQLPSLKTLYLSQNRNINIVDAIEQAKPVTSPLMHLDLSYTAEEMSDFPDFGIMPHLLKLNISGNIISNLAPKHFAGLCKLNVLDTANVTAEFGVPCDCWTINKWLFSRNVKFQPLLCNSKENDCLDTSVSDTDLELFQKCLLEVKEVQKAEILKIVVPCVISAVLLIIIAGGTCYFLRRKKLKQEQNREKIPPEPLLVHLHSNN